MAGNHGDGGNNQEKEPPIRWWFKNVIVPILGGSGIIGLLIAIIEHPPGTQNQIPQHSVTITQPNNVQASDLIVTTGFVLNKQTDLWEPVDSVESIPISSNQVSFFIKWFNLIPSKEYKVTWEIFDEARSYKYKGSSTI